MTEAMIGEAVNAASPAFSVAHQGFLIANGDSRRIEVLRSPLVRDGDALYASVRQYIEDHSLSLAAQATFDDEDWMFGEVEMSVFVGSGMEANGS